MLAIVVLRSPSRSESAPNDVVLQLGERLDLSLPPRPQLNAKRKNCVLRGTSARGIGRSETLSSLGP